MMNRRSFLAQAAAAPLVFGLSEALGQEHRRDPEWYRRALDRMKRTDRHGIVLVVPADSRKRRDFGEALHGLLNGPRTDAQALFTEAVFICLTPELADGRVRPAGGRENRFLLDPRGRRIAADRIETIADPAKFVASFESFLHGRTGERLAAHARLIEGRLGDGVKRAIRRLDADSIEEREAAAARVLKEADSIIPYLAHLGRTERSLERRQRCRDLIGIHFRSLAAKRMPYGTHPVAQVIDPCPGCGLGFAPRQSRHFLSFLTK